MQKARQSPVAVRGATAPPAVQQTLPFAEPAAPVRPPLAAPARSQRLWFCLRLPNLSLEAVAATAADPAAPLAVVGEENVIHRVLQVDTRAAAAGVQPGQSINAALALLPELQAVERSELREQQVLERLATWLERFSSFVSIAARDVLLLEIAGSLRLFGGLRALRQQLADGLFARGFAADMAIAPTPLAATWLARAGQRRCIRAEANLAAALRSLPLDCLDWPEGLSDSLRGMGVFDIGDCLRLPREGFVRRFGAEYLLQLDRGLGRLPDPRDSWRAPERFCRDFEMSEEQSDRELLLNVCHELLLLLERFLLARQLGTQRLCFSFFHLRGAATELRLGAAGVDRSASRWLALLRIRFGELQLPAAVIAVRLQSGLAEPMQAETAGLSFAAKPQRRRYSVAQLAERLIARIGRQAVNALTLVAEHRPEYAWQAVNPLADGSTGIVLPRDGLRQRPLWMLPEPAPLTVAGDYPLHDGCRLRLLEGPERLETGWWDEHGISRDYYTAVDAAGTQLWIFRNRQRQPGWYLHGFFG